MKPTIKKILAFNSIVLMAAGCSTVSNQTDEEDDDDHIYHPIIIPGTNRSTTNHITPTPSKPSTQDPPEVKKATPRAVTPEISPKPTPRISPRVTPRASIGRGR